MALRDTRFAWFSLTVLAACVAAAPAEQPARSPTAKTVTFATLRGPSQEEARAQALSWLEKTGKADAATLGAFDEIWKGGKPVLGQVADTLALGDPSAKAILAEARDPKAAAPTEVPAAIKDTKQPDFSRANLALAYAKALSARRVHEEALQALLCVRPEQVVDPAAYLFHKAVAEHGLGRAREAAATITRLLDDVPDAPERYKQLASLMVFDMMTWKDKDLGAVARLMDNVGRRLELGRAGPQTRKLQGDVIAILDKLIEDDTDGPRTPNPDPPPPGPEDPEGPGKTGRQTNDPLDDSIPASTRGDGKVSEKRLKELAGVWGKLPEKERPKVMQELTREMPPRYRDIIEKYFKELSRAEMSGR